MEIYYDENIGDYICDTGIELPYVTSVTPKSDYTLDLTFSTGERKLYDAKRFLTKNPNDPLHNIHLFMRAHTDGCSVAWNEDIDIAPEELYENSIEL